MDIDADGRCVVCGGEGNRNGCAGCANGRATLPVARRLLPTDGERIARLEDAVARALVQIAELQCDIAEIRRQVPGPVYSSHIAESVALRDQRRRERVDHVEAARRFGEALAHGDHAVDTTARGGLDSLGRRGT